MAIPSFIFDAQTTTPEELAQRRALAQALLNRGQTGIANNIGEGLAQFGQALAGRLQMGSVNRAESSARDKAYGLLSPLLGGSSPSPAPVPMDGSAGLAKASGSPDIATGIVATANALGIDPVDLGTAISYETAGTFDPAKAGPRTQWGQHKGLIQFGEPQAKQYGVDWNNPVDSQLGPDGAVAKYLKAAGVKPGMGMMDVYSAINAGSVGRNNASDANNGGAPGTVADKVNGQMTSHRAKAQALLASVLNGGAVPQVPAQAPAMPAPAPQGTAMTGFPPQAAPMAPQIAQQPPRAPQIVPTAGPAPVQQQMATPQGPMSAYQRMVMTSLGKDGGIDDPRNRAIAQQAGLRSPSPTMVGNNSVLGNNSITANTALPQGQPPQAPQMPVQGGGRLDQLRSILMSPSAAFLDDTTKQILVNEYKMELERSQPPDQNAELERQYKQAQIAKLLAEIEQSKNPDARKKLGLNPIYGKRGDKLIIMQPSESGGLVEAPLPDGVTLEPGTGKIDLGTSWGITDRSGNVIQQIPKDLAGEAAAKALGGAQGEAAGQAPAAKIGAEQTISKIDEILADPGLGDISGWQSYLPDPMLGAYTGGKGLDLRRRVEQLQGSAFLEAYNGLKGGGQITEVEGKKAENALARLNTAQTDEGYKQALKDFRDAVEVGYQKLAAKSGGKAPPLAAPTVDTGGYTPEQITSAKRFYKLQTDAEAVQKMKDNGTAPMSDAPKASNNDVAPQDVDPELWKHMTPEEKKLWQ